jgi:hypothetical protein
MKLKKISLFIFFAIPLISMESVFAQTAVNTSVAIDPQSFAIKFPHYFEDPWV